MADHERIVVERDAELDGLVTITLDRPEKLNALDVAMHDELQAALAELETDHAARVVVLTGAGRAFSAAPSSATGAPSRRSTTSTAWRGRTSAAAPAS